MSARSDLSPLADEYLDRSRGVLIPRGLAAAPHAAPANDDLVEPEWATEALWPSWQFRDLSAALAGDNAHTTPTLLMRHDRTGMVYAGRINGLHCDSGSGKSLLAAFLAVERLGLGEHVVWVDCEDPNEDLLVERLRAFGVADDVIAAQVHYVNPDEPATVAAVEQLVTAMASYGSCLVVIDSTGEALGLNGLDENKDLDVDQWKRILPHRFERAGHTVVMIDHGTKSADNPLYPSGSKRKRALISGASWFVEQVTPFDRDHPGKLKVTCAKDRHGNYRRGQVGAWVAVDPTGRHLAMLVEAPDDDTQPVAQGSLLALLKPVVDIIRSAGVDGIQSKNTLRAKVRVKGKGARGTDVDGAVALAADLGCVRVEAGARGAQIYYWIRDVTPADIAELTS